MSSGTPIEALKKYSEAMDLGNSRREEAIEKIKEGIALYPTIQMAIDCAEGFIAQYTKSDFMYAHFYELVKSTAKEMQDNGCMSENMLHRMTRKVSGQVKLIDQESGQ